jgi:ATP-binding cassette, subfamily B, multidrug efflux pump
METKTKAGRTDRRVEEGAPGEGVAHATCAPYLGHPFRWFWALLGSRKPSYVVGIVLDLVSVACSMIPAVVIGHLVDDVLDGGRTELLPLYLALIVGVPLARALVGLLYRYLFEISSQDAILRLRTGMYRHLQDLDGSFYDSADTGDIMARATGDLDMIRHFIAFTVYASAENLVLFVAGLAYLFSVDWILALCASAVSPLILMLTVKLGKEVRPAFAEVRARFALLNTKVQQNISGHRVVRAFARKDHETRTFEVENDAYRQANVRSSAVWQKYLPWLEGLSGFLSVPVIIVGGWLVMTDRMTLGGLVTFSGLLYVISNPMRMSGWLMNEIQRFSASAEKILELLLVPPRIVSPAEGGHRGPVVGKVEFADVSYAYGERLTEATPEALRHVTFTAEPGWTVGILGETGSGKTTLVQLISRFRDPTTGAVKVDGRDVRRFDLATLRRSVGVVLQDVFLFSDTIEGNIAFGVPDVPDETVFRAARAADADGFIRHAPDGYQTIIGERGVGLSGGQRQRIALARALATEPRILILDDTTSAVDMETEAAIQEALQRDYGDRTVFIVASRISSVRHADLILVLQDGEIAERGTHASLIAQDGLYADIFRTQAGLDGEEGDRGQE